MKEFIILSARYRLTPQNVFPSQLQQLLGLSPALSVLSLDAPRGGNVACGGNDLITRRVTLNVPTLGIPPGF